MPVVIVKTVSDQADGLRRLMTRDRGRVIALVGSHAGAGATSVVLNLAAALWQQGQDVLVLDEHGGPRSAAASCAEPARATWSDVSAGRASFASAAGRAWGAVPVFPARPGLIPAGADPRQVVPGRIVLVDAAPDPAGGLSPLAREADEIVVVLRPESGSLKAAYACIKALHQAHALQQLRFLLTHATDAADAGRIAGNLALTGSRYLALSLQSVGCISADPRLPHAHRLGLGVVQAFPATPCAAEMRRIAADLLHWPARPRPATAAAA